MREHYLRFDLAFPDVRMPCTVSCRPLDLFFFYFFFLDTGSSRCYAAAGRSCPSLANDLLRFLLFRRRSAFDSSSARCNENVNLLGFTRCYFRANLYEQVFQLTKKTLGREWRSCLFSETAPLGCTPTLKRTSMLRTAIAFSHGYIMIGFIPRTAIP